MFGMQVETQPNPEQNQGSKGENGGLESAVLRRALLQTGLSILVIFLLALFAGFHYRQEIAAYGESFVEALGGFGLLLCYFCMDAFMLPLPQDPFAVLALTGGMGFGEVVIWAGTGSIIGGCFAFFVAGKLGQTRWFKQRFRGRIEKGEAYMAKWGVWAVVAAGLTPFPYSIACWAGGVLRMGFWPFLWASLAGRYVRVASYLWIIERGMGF
jgi:membrane protein YqaA with SNARE-associated domain